MLKKIHEELVEIRKLLQALLKPNTPEQSHEFRCSICDSKISFNRFGNAD